MRILFGFLILAAAAVAVALVTRLTAGYVLFVAPPYRIEVTLNFFLIIAVASFVAGYFSLRLLRHMVALPRSVRDWRARRHRDRAREKQDAALVALLEGRYGKARQYADEALRIPRSTGLPALLAARSALDMHDFDAAGAMLARPEVQAKSLAVPRLMLEAEMLLEQGRATEALERVAALRKEAGAHTAALRLELRALRAAGRHAEIPAVVEQLVKREVYGAEEGALLRAAAHADALAALATDANGLRAYWNKLSDADQRRPRVARSGAMSFLALGGDREAAAIIGASLEREWDSDLALLYSRCRPADGSKQLREAERWLAAHSDDPALLHALGVICRDQELWGKAQTSFEASLALEDTWRTRLALGEMLGRLGRTDEANAHLAHALKLATAELGHQPDPPRA